MHQSDLKKALKELYTMSGFRPVVHADPSNVGWLAVVSLEASIALLAKELRGDLLDAGCGTSPYDGYFRHVRSKTNFDYSGERGRVHFRASATHLPLSPGSFDSILCTEVLEHVPDPARTWREFYRVLRPGGRVLLTTPCFWPPHELPYDFYRYPYTGLAYLAEQAGFRVLRMIPRGGRHAFWGQVTLFSFQRFFTVFHLTSLWNRVILAIDRNRHNPHLSLGWTILAEK